MKAQREEDHQHMKGPSLGSLAGTFLLSAPAVVAGGPQLRDLSLSSELFKASSMQAVVNIVTRYE